MQEILNLIAEIEGWNDNDWRRYKDGQVDFDGAFVFAARKKKLTELKEKLAKLPKEKA